MAKAGYLTLLTAMADEIRSLKRLSLSCLQALLQTRRGKLW